MPATIKIKNSSTASAVPTSSDLVQGELAVNVTDKRLFTENSGGTVVELGTNPSILTLPDGSASAPTLTNDGDTNTGIFFPAADTVGITTGGTERARVDSSGNLGLGVTPSAWFTGGGYKVMQIGPGMSFDSGTDFRARIASNGFVNSAGDWKYVNTGYASNYNQSSGQHQWYTAASGTAGNAITFTQAMTLDASGNLGVGTTNTVGRKARIAGEFAVTNDSSNAYEIYFQSTSSYARIGPTYNAGGAYVPLTFWTSDTERARIDASGNLLVGTTSTARTSNGIKLLPGTDDGTVSITNARSSGGNPIELNRQVSDGTLIAFYQADTLEGSISVSGTTVSYNGGHLARYAQTIGAKDESLKKGTVLSNLDEMNTYTDAEGGAVDNEQLNKVKVSDVEGDAHVAGVFVNWSHDEDHNVDEINMAMTGDMIIRIAQGTTVARGDLLMSAGDGTAKPQGDDIVRAKTIAKVTSTHVTCTYEDGSYCVPCVLMAC
jgi:hypothetical protein